MEIVRLRRPESYGTESAIIPEENMQEMDCGLPPLPLSCTTKLSAPLEENWDFNCRQVCVYLVTPAAAEPCVYFRLGGVGG